MLFQSTLVFGLAAVASAHITMMNPAPFGKATLTSFPLKPEEFPCKQRPGVYSMESGINQWNAGETQKLHFMGSAVHGGGSCQFSITTDSEPTTESQWKVIHSIIGNCITDQPGNIGDNATAEVALVHPVTMPSNIPDGRYTFAWTWLNKIGNREFYMNCAPIQVGSSSSAASGDSAAKVLSDLPDMFVTNLPSKDHVPTPPVELQCSTVEREDFEYPEPGQSVARGEAATTNPGHTQSGAACAAQNKLGAGAGKIGSPSPGTPSTPSSPSTPSTPSKPSNYPSQPQVSEKPAASPAAPVKGEPQQSKVPAIPDSGSGGVFAPGASPAPAASSSAAAPPAAKPTPPAAKPEPSTPPQTGSDNNTTPVNSACTPCTNDGAVVCIGTKQFGLCNRGCAVAQDLAAGMVCEGGAVVGAATKMKRHAFPRAHLKRHFTRAHHF